MSTIVGEIKLWSSDTIPAGWMVCDGRLLDVAQYTPLYTVLGNTYGGTPAQFNLPDLRGLSVRGKTDGASLGSTMGADSVTLTSDHLPPHTHTASFASTTTANGVADVRIPVDGGDSQFNEPATNRILAKGTVGSNPAKMYSTNAKTSTLKPFDAQVTLPAITGTVAVTPSVNASVQAVPTVPPSILLHYIIAAVGVLPTY